MRQIRKIFIMTAAFTAIFAAAVHLRAAADDARLEASVDKNTIYVGDRITYTVSIIAPKETEVEFPKPGLKIGDFYVKDSTDVKASGKGARLIRARSYIITAYKTGKSSIPPLEARYKDKGASEWKSLATRPIDITVKSLLAVNPKAKDIRDIKGIIWPPGNFLAKIVLWLSAALLLYLIFRAAKRFLFKGRPLPPKSPHEIAYAELESIKMSGLIADGKMREYYFRLSGCVRRYIEGRFYLRAPEMTTEEFLAAAKDSESLSAARKELLKNFLSSADKAKFAKYAATREEAEASFNFAKRFVDETKEEAVEARKGKR